MQEQWSEVMTLDKSVQRKIDEAINQIVSGELKCKECGNVAVTFIASAYHEKVSIRPLCASHTTPIINTNHLSVGGCS